tara:strand:- start:41665 stop:42882 length:1218 start_codon:yes stop_codon:yes gene_type:complete
MENEYIEKMFGTNLININEDLQYYSLKSLFIEIQKAYKELGKISIKKQHGKKPIGKLMNDIKQHSGTYLPVPVLDSIKTHYLGTTYIVETNIGPLLDDTNCMIKLTFYKMQDNPITQNTLELYSNAMLTWLIVAKKYETDNCLKQLNVDIYLTKEKKQLNAKIGDIYDANGGSIGQGTVGNHRFILGSNNVNTALTYRCHAGESMILLYRSEDLIKTFFHETFHTLNFDFSNPAKQEVKHLFNVNSPLRLFEAYCETWARIVNAMYYVILLNPDMNWQTFNKNFRIIITIESVYSAIQCCKILKYMNLTYDDVIANNVFDKFKETSNVFSYYVITAILMMNPSMFLRYCKQNGLNLLKFNESNLQGFITFLSKARLNSNIKLVETKLNDFSHKRSLRMAIFDIKN